jgi:serine/threonine protein kinase
MHHATSRTSIIANPWRPVLASVTMAEVELSSPREIEAAIGGSLKVQALIAGGGLAVVYRVTWEGRDCALKLLQPQMLSSPTTVARFVREGKILRALDHPNVLRIHALGEDPRMPYIICEYLDGGSLAALLRHEGPLPWPRAFEIVLAVLDGLEAAHEHGIIHRDVKPANVLLRSDGAIKLADFGIAKPARTEGGIKTTTGVVLGTPAYMAPELIQGAAATARSDVYCTGLVLFEVLSGQLPFEPDEPADGVLQRLRGEPAMLLSAVLENVPARLDELLSIALENTPVKRYPDAAAFRAAVQRTRDELLASRVQLRPTGHRRALDDPRTRPTVPYGPPRLAEPGSPPTLPGPWLALLCSVALFLFVVVLLLLTALRR